MIDYTFTGEECRKAWWKYKENAIKSCIPAISVRDFVAGWNAAKETKKEENNGQD